VASTGKPLRSGKSLLGLDCEAISLHRKSKSVYSKGSDPVYPRISAGGGGGAGERQR
jgi:hypothetical protein